MVDCIHTVLYQGVHAAGVGTVRSVYQEMPGAACTVGIHLPAVTVEGQSKGSMTIHLGVGPRLSVYNIDVLSIGDRE